MKLRDDLIPPYLLAKVRYMPSTTSTMDVAAAWARDGAPHLAVVMAGEQTAARGRMGRVWQMFEGHSFAATFILTRHTGPHLPLVVAVALLRALRGFAPHAKLALKWPNDVLLEGKKLAGILIEQVMSSTAPPLHHSTTYLAGIGLNLTRSPAMMESFPGIPLSDAAPAPGIEDMLVELSACLKEVLAVYGESGWSALADEYVQNCCTLGQRVNWYKNAKETLVGQAQGLTPEGALVMVDDAGEVHHIHSGDVIAQGQTHAA